MSVRVLRCNPELFCIRLLHITLSLRLGRAATRKRQGNDRRIEASHLHSSRSHFALKLRDRERSLYRRIVRLCAKCRDADIETNGQTDLEALTTDTIRQSKQDQQARSEVV